MARIFISYSHKDEPLRAELEKHFALLKRQGELDIWTDHCILPGAELNSEISAGLETADIIMLLVSSDFLASDYCFSVEMTRAMERHLEKTAVVVPLILRACDWHSAPFGGLKALPTDGRPVMKWPSQDDAFLDVVQHLRKLLATTRPMPQQSPSAVKAAVVSARPAATSVPMRSSNLALPREFTDQDKHDFAEATFDYIRSYFEGSLEELAKRNPGITGKLREKSGQAFTVVLFRDGQRLAGCYVRLGGMMSSTGIAYSGSENSADNSYNEQLSVNADKQSLYLRATMSMFHGGRDLEDKLSQEGAAEHLWSMFVGPMQ